MILRNDFFDNTNRFFFFDDPFAVAGFVNRHYPDEAAQAIQRADDAAARRFKFSQRWDMERTWEYIEFKDEIDWLHQPGNDPEWIYAFNRMKFWIDLGQAYALTKNEAYAEAFVHQMTHWVEHVRQDDPRCKPAWRSIEAGIRLENWLKAVRYFRASPALNDEAIRSFTGSVMEHAEFIMNTWNSYNLMSNWGVLANHGLFLAGIMLPESERTKKYLEESIRRLHAELGIQVYRDGFHWEQSPMYHNEVLHCYLDCIILAQRNRISLPGDFVSKVKSMVTAIVFSAKPNHHEIAMGDSDDIDQRDLITRAAQIFGEPLFKSRGYIIPDYDSAWEMGEEGIRKYEDLESLLPQETDKAFSDSGNFYFRSSWAEGATFLHFHAGTLGAGHGHADQLHFDIFSRGEDVFIDPGRFTYVFGGGREEFKEQAAHNTLTVDNRDIYKQKDSWECFDLTRAVNRNYFSNGQYGYTEAGLLAWTNPEGVYANRRIVYIKPDIFIICDEFYGKGTHTYTQYFNMNNAGTLEGGNDRYVYRPEKVNASIQFLTPSVTSSVKTSSISRHYNRREESPRIECKFQGEDFCSAFTVISLSNPEETAGLAVNKIPVHSNFKDIQFTDTQIEALEIKTPDLDYVLVIAHEEYASPTDTFRAGGCIGFGNCVIFNRKNNEQETGTVLLY